MCHYRILAFFSCVCTTRAIFTCPDGTRTSSTLDANSSNPQKAACLYGDTCPPKYTCQHPAQVPGWKICLDSLYDEKGECLVYSFVYSFGVTKEWSFDENMARFGCTVHLFDPTVEEPPQRLGPRIIFHNWGLRGGHRNEAKYTRFVHAYYGKVGGVLKTLSEIEHELGHRGRSVSILKMDCEGCEWDVFGFMKPKNHPLRNINQLLIELHFCAAYGLNDTKSLELVDNSWKILSGDQNSNHSRSFFGQFSHSIGSDPHLVHNVSSELLEVGIRAHLCLAKIGFERTSCAAQQELSSSDVTRKKRAANLQRAFTTYNRLDGQFVRSPIGKELFFMKNGSKHSFASIDTFASYGYDFSTIHSVEVDLEYISSGSDCCSKNDSGEKNKGCTFCGPPIDVAVSSVQWVPTSRIEPCSQKTAMKFGQSFAAGLETTLLIDTSCRLNNGHPICCAVFNNQSADRPPNVDRNSLDRTSCNVIKTYIPSTYELEQIEKAKYFDAIADVNVRTAEILQFVSSASDMNDSFIWLEQVKRHSQNIPLTYNDLDMDSRYLSRFNMTRKCLDGSSSSWYEWIEPLTLHARNPFSLLGHTHFNRAALASSFPKFSERILRTSLMSNDHVLVARPSDKFTSPSKFLFDAGTSTFQSSLWWFTCIYLQQNISFDQVFGWEYTLLEPSAFWDEVPGAMREKYHFYNTKMSSDMHHGNSPLRMIKAVSTENDFVSFKLDIDTPEVEIPTVLSILNDKRLHALIDEFFFEFHFRCELLMDMGWDYSMPEMYQGLVLKRWDAMILFQKLRLYGIRSHFWP